MIGPVHHEIRPHGPDAAAIRLLVSARVERVVESAGDGSADRRCDDDHRCPPPERVLPSPGAIPYDRFLEKRNREDTVEFSLGAPEKVCPPERYCPPEREVRGADRGERPARVEPRGGGDGAGRPGRWPRLGEVSPAPERVAQRRLETVYRVTVQGQVGRIDLIG